MTLDLNALREAHANLNKTGNDNEGKYIMPKEGINLVRILPPKDDNDLFFAETKIHRVVEDGNKRNFHCRRVHNEDCPLCDAYFQLWKMHENSYDTIEESKKKDSMTPFKKAARSIKPSKRFYMNAIHRDDGNKVKVLSVGIKVMDKILADMTGDFGDITHLENGNDFKVTKETKPGQDWPVYDKSGTRPVSTPAGTKQEIAALSEQMHDIKSLVKLETLEDATKLANIYCPKEIPATEDSAKESKTSDEDFTKTLQS